MWEILAIFLSIILYHYLVIRLYNAREGSVGKLATLLFASLVTATVWCVSALCIMSQTAFESYLYDVYNKVEWCRTVNIYKATLCNSSEWYVYVGVNKTNVSIAHVYVECYDGLLNKTRKIGYLDNYYYLVKMVCKYDGKMDRVLCLPYLPPFLN